MTNSLERIDQFLYNLSELDIKLWVDGERLRCTAPKGVLTAALQADIGARKTEILTFLRNNQRLNEPEQIAPVSRDGSLPLSFAQQRLWFLDQMENAQQAYILIGGLELQGQLDAALLKRCFIEVVQRHEVLRTTFPVVDGQPVQSIAPTLALPFQVIDLSHLSPDAQADQIQQFLAEEAQRSFDLAHGPLIHLRLIQMGQSSDPSTESDTPQLPRAKLLVTLHHIVADGWSFGVLLQEVCELYAAGLVNRPALLPPLTIQYGDFAQWQRTQMQGNRLAHHLQYWRQQLAGAPTQLELPTDRIRPPVQSFEGAVVRFKVGGDLLRNLKALSNQAGATLFMTLHAAFATLLSRYSGQEDIVVGTPIANRNRQEVEPLIGFFVNMLPLRTDLTGNPTFLELLAHARSVTLAAYDHQDIPFEQLVDELRPERNLSHSPIFQVMFAWQNAVLKSNDFAGLTIHPVKLQSISAQFDLTLIVEEELQQDVIEGRFEYNTDIFDTATIQRMVGHFQMLLRGIVASPETRIAQLPLLTETEHEQIVHTWNDTARDYDLSRCLHHWIEAQAAQTPDAVALVYQGQMLTYGEMNARANQLAHHLRDLGVGPEILVGICVERSFEMVIGLLAILKAGGAYVPLAPDYPAERLAFMIEDVQAPVLLTQAKFTHLAPSQTHVVVLDQLDPVWAQHPKIDPAVPMKSENLAYVIFTSGSTGYPKGAMNTHRAIVNRLLWMQEAYGLSASDRVLQKTPFSFDVSVWEFFWPLMNGAQLIIAKPGGHQDNAYLVELIADMEVTTLHFVPPMLQHFIEEPEVSRCHSLKRVICSGEALPFDLQERFFARLGTDKVELHNLYGPTEAAIDVTYWACEPNHALGIVPIGRPVANTEIYVLDPYRQPVPIGVHGELHIGGVQVARGYLNRPELTAEKFIPDSFSADPTRRLYKSGDLVRALPDGTIEFLGRIDHQVKIRGFRIELGEIEAQLNEHQAVQECVVVAREDRPGHKMLAAYVVTKSQAASGQAAGADLQAGSPTLSELLREYLKTKLPEYMVPTAFILIDALPLSLNGKIDRRALPAPDLRGDEAHYVAPQHPNEKILATIWLEVLGVEKIGVHDNFFALGGDSISSIQVVTRAKQQGLFLSVKQLFLHQTIAELATAADSGRQIQAEQGTVQGNVPLSPIQQAFFAQDLAAPHHYNQSVLLKTAPDIIPSHLEEAFQAILYHHDALRLRFTSTKRMNAPGTWQQFHADSSQVVGLEMVDLSGLPQADEDASIAITAERLQSGLDLTNGPLLRAALFTRGARQPAGLLLVIHHLVVDGVSWRILIEDLQTAYQQLAAGKEVQLPAKTSSFQQWVQRLTTYAQSDVLDSEWAYWLVEERNAVPTLPVDFLSVPVVNTVASEGTHTVSLDVKTTQLLLREVPRRAGVQINDLLLTALLRTFTQWSGKHQLLLDLEGHGREALFDDLDISRTVGWFTTIAPILLTSCPEELSHTALHEQRPDDPVTMLKSVHAQLAAMPNRGIGYGLLRYLSGDAEQRLHEQAQPEVLFNYLGQFRQDQFRQDQFRQDQFRQGQAAASLFELVQDSCGPDYSPQNQRSHLLEINAIVIDDVLEIRWRYSQNLHASSTIENLAQSFVQELTDLIIQVQAIDKNVADIAADGLSAPVQLKSVQPKPVPRQATMPLSFAQERLWFQDQLEGASATYNNSIAVQLVGQLDLTAAERAYNEIIRRHESLRTTFLTVEDQPMQRITPTLELPIEVVDLRILHLSGQQLEAQLEPERQLQHALTQESQRPFDLACDPLIRLVLYKLPDAPATDDPTAGEDRTRHAIQVTMHHIITDGWSMGVFMEEFAALYNAFASNQPSPLPELPIQYMDYGVWQRQRLTGDILEHELAYWRGQLHDLPTLALPMARPRVATSTFRGGRQVLEIPPTLYEPLQQLSQQQGATIFMTLTAAFKSLLHWYSGQMDIVVGTDVANRSLVECEGLIGFFVNQLVLRTDLSGDPTFLQLLERVQTTAIEAYDHQDLPFERLVQALNPKREIGITPLFQVKIAAQNAPESRAKLSGLLLESLAFNSEQAKFDLLINIWPLATHVQIDFEYNADLFEDATIARMRTHFQDLLATIVAQPELPLSDLTEILDTQYRTQRQERSRTRSHMGLQKLEKIRQGRTRQRIDKRRVKRKV